MRPNPDAFPGLEVDGKGEPIPYANRLSEDRTKVDDMIKAAASDEEHRNER
jgi:hypothetical protein